MDKPGVKNKIEKIAELIIKSRHLIFFTGAGISTESGIPDFRSPGGIWERFDPEDFTYDKFLTDENARRKHWRLFRELSIKAEPNAAHLAIAELYKLGKLDCVITQNIDNLHQKSGIPDDMMYELHGSMRKLICISCRRAYPFVQVMERSSGDEPPNCEACHGILKIGAVFFGEVLPEAVIGEAIRRSIGCDLMIVVGSTLTVYPAAFIPAYTVNAGGRLIIINLTATSMDNQADIVLNAKAAETISAIVSRVKESLA